MRSKLTCLVILLGCAALAPAATIQVGPTRTHTKVQAGYDAASSGDIIEIDAGTYYQGDGWVYVNGKHNLTFRGVGATRPVIDAGNSLLRSKGIFVIEIGTNNTTIENLEIRNTRMNVGPGGNAAGVRAQGTDLTLRNCYIHDCDNGVLNGTGNLLFEYCEFDHNGEGDGQSHNMYISNADSFTLQHCYVHNAYEGHEVKTRAKVNKILYNCIVNGPNNPALETNASYEIQPANGGTTYIIGNLIQQGPNTANSTMISYADEGFSIGYGKNVYIVNNTIVNDRGGGTIVSLRSGSIALLQNNIIVANGAALWGGSTSVTKTEITNWLNNSPSLLNQAGYDYHLTAASTGAINQGTAAGVGVDGFSLTPNYQYVHPASRESRPTDTTIDIGAYEYVVPNQAPTVNAGSDIDVYEGQAVQLHAAAGDPDNDPLNYAWTQPAGLAVVLSGAATTDASFTAPVVATTAQAGLTFTVTVSDGKAGPVSDSVNVRVRILGDINHDDTVDMVDLLTFADAWDTTTGQPGFAPLCDLNNDGVVDVIDLLSLAESWGRTLQ